MLEEPCLRLHQEIFVADAKKCSLGDAGDGICHYERIREFYAYKDLLRVENQDMFIVDSIKSQIGDEGR